MEEIILNGKTYVEKKESKPTDYSIVRSYAAGVFCGRVESMQDGLGGMKVKLLDARRLWYWKGAASLSQLSIDGVDTSESKFPEAVESVELFNVVEILPCSEKAKKSIDKVKVWKA